MDKIILWTLIVFFSFVGACGNILWKMSSNKIGQVSWTKLLDLKWDITTLFTPIVFFSLTLNFISRFASIVPTGYMKITQIMTAMTVFSLLFTALLEYLIFKTRYPSTVWIGMIMGLVSIYLMSQNV